MKKRFFAKLIMRCPGNAIRIFLYRKLLSYSIGRNVRVGKSILLCQSVKIGDNVVIRDNNLIKCKNVTIGHNSKINSGNTITGSSSFTMGKDSRIINNHYIDVSRDVSIGDSSWIAGRGSQLWTHGSLYTKNRSKPLGIQIKHNVYVSSNSSIAPGVTIESFNLIGLGSVVNRSIITQKNIVAGNPARIVKEGVYWKDNW